MTLFDILNLILAANREGADLVTKAQLDAMFDEVAEKSPELLDAIGYDY